MDKKQFFEIAQSTWPLAKLFLSAAFGAFALYTLNMLNNRQPFSFFKALNIGLIGRPWRIFGDMIISSAIGAGIVLMLFRPDSAAEAGASGLGLTGILSALGSDIKRSRR